MLNPDKLAKKEYLFLAELMEQGANEIYRRVCEDMSLTAYNIFTPEEKDVLEKAYHDWNGDPEDFISGYFPASGGYWLTYYAAKFRELAGGGE